MAPKRFVVHFNLILPDLDFFKKGDNEVEKNIAVAKSTHSKDLELISGIKMFDNE